MVVLQAEDRQFGLVVDGINDTQEIVVKPLGKQLKGLTLYAGATIMGDGRVALILDVLGIGQRSGVFDESREQARAADKQKAQSDLELEKQRLAALPGRHLRSPCDSTVACRQARGVPAVEHRACERRPGGAIPERILPLVSLREVLEPGMGGSNEAADPVQVVVFNDGDRSVGMVVDEIVDVVEEAAKVRKKSDRKGLLGSAVVGKRVTDFLDLNAVIRATEGNWDSQRRRTHERQDGSDRGCLGILAGHDQGRSGHGRLCSA